MKSIFAKTFGGLSPGYHARQLFYGLLFAVFSWLSVKDNLFPPPLGVWALVAVNVLLYPYSRFVYEGVMGFLVGDNFFFVNVWMMLFVKFITMYLCWFLSLFIAPVGLLYLYFYHSARSRD
jgi:hypothetical protein